MKENTRSLGRKYEKMAADYLIRYGLQIVTMNYYCRSGEIDIIAKDGSYLVFCEVKYRASTTGGYPAEAVTAKKKTRICKCAMYYLTVHGLLYIDVRFDVISILDKRIEWTKNAFEYQG